MEAWLVQAIISVTQIAVVLGGVVAILRWNGYRKVTRREFQRQQALNDAKFIEMVENWRDTKQTLDRIERDLKAIESRVKKMGVR